MYSRATRAELWLFGFVALFLSGAPSGLYVKLFDFEPPTPEAALMVPVLLLMIGNILLRVRATLTGLVALAPWFALAVLACASWFWSVSQADTVREGSILLVSVVYLGMVAGIADWENLLAVLWRVCVGLIGLSLFLYGIVPGIGKMAEVYEGALTGPWFEKNATGQFFMFAALVNYALFMVRPQRIVAAVAWAVLCGGCIILTESATALIAFVAVTGVIALIVPLRRNFAISLPALIALVVIGGPVAYLSFGEGAAVLQALGKSGTLTGRIPIWEALIDFSLDDRRWLGHGYAAFWVNEFEFTTRAFIYEEIKYRVPHSHNTLIEARLDLGWAGAGLWLAALVQLVVMSAVRMRSSHGVYLTLPLACAIILVAAVEVSPFSVTNMGGMLFVLALAKMTLNPSRADRRSGGWRFIGNFAPKSGPYAVARA